MTTLTVRPSGAWIPVGEDGARVVHPGVARRVGDVAVRVRERALAEAFPGALVWFGRGLGEDGSGTGTWWAMVPDHDRLIEAPGPVALAAELRQMTPPPSRPGPVRARPRTPLPAAAASRMRPPPDPPCPPMNISRWLDPDPDPGPARPTLLARALAWVRAWAA
ncbi:hypothetical protein LO762_29360 [Actinocorallia sp. API 0066]|uniref:hypothetical protein n=1 Tax=Actinocorallia sp. API 0066 TaxID=2896846 RepID=UPI001E284838|nr:hypothetical protein [Actinocorallia sp. API 0066]MCD0453259.1 hypothetical protein [Actinocorallia sp. API 0066]